MAAIQVTQYTRQTYVGTANKAMTVTVDLTGDNFSVYVYISTGQQYKVVRGTPWSFSIAKGDTVEAEAMGTGTIQVTTN